MAREQWKTEIIKSKDFLTNPTNYYLDTTGGFYTNALSTSIAKMPRVVNVVPSIINENLTWHKRIGFDSLYATYASGLCGFYITEDGSTSYGFANTGALVTTSLPTWASSANDPLNFFLLWPSETAIGTTRNVLCTSYEVNTIAVATSTARMTTAGWFFPSDALNTTRSGTVTSGLATITGLSATSDMYVGQVVYSTRFATTNYVYILSIDSSSQVTVTENANATATENITFFNKCRILDADFPGNVVGTAITGRMVPLNGYVFVMTSAGNIVNSDINSLASWSATSTLKAQTYTDNGGAGLMKYKNTIMAFGTTSTEFFRDVGNAVGSPLQLIEELTMHMGCLLPNHTCYLDDSVAFIGVTKENNVSVYILDGFNPKRVSTPEIDSQLSSNPTYGSADWHISSFHYQGKTVLALTSRFGLSSSTGLVNTARWTTFLYFVEANKWVEWRGPEGKIVPWAQGGFTSSGATNATLYSPYIYAVNFAVGKVWQMLMTTPIYKDHDGTETTFTYNYVIQTPIITLNTDKRKFLRRMRLINHASASYTPSTNLTVYWSDDFGTTWVTRSGISTQKDFTGCGSFRKRIFRLVENSANEYALNGIEIDYKEGVN